MGLTGKKPQTPYQKAVHWINEEYKRDPKISLNKLLNEAYFRFNLSPNDSNRLEMYFESLKSEQ